MAWRFLLLGFAFGLGACSESSPPAPPAGGIGGMIGGAGGGSGGAGGIAGSTGGNGGVAGSAGMAGNGGEGGSAGAGGAAGGAGMAGNGGDGGSAGAGGVVPSGACNLDDFAILASLVDPAEVRATSAACALSPECETLSREELVACVAECVSLAYPGLSEPCTTCYGELEDCSNFLCANECAGDADDARSCPDSIPCTEVGYRECVALLSDCVGPPPAEDLPI